MFKNIVAQIKRNFKIFSQNREQNCGFFCLLEQVNGQNYCQLSNSLFMVTVFRYFFDRRSISTRHTLSGHCRLESTALTVDTYCRQLDYSLCYDNENNIRNSRQYENCLLLEILLVNLKSFPLAYEFFPIPTFRPVLGEFQGDLARNFFVFLCVLCILNAVGTVLVSKFGINFLKNQRRKNPLFFLSN